MYALDVHNVDDCLADCILLDPVVKENNNNSIQTQPQLPKLEVTGNEKNL